MQDATDTPHIPGASQGLLYFEIPYYGFLPAALGLHPERRPPERIRL
jgi:hypothetical protein